MKESEMIVSLNKEIIKDIPIEVLEERLEIEELEIRGAAWTGCGCDCAGDICGVDW